MATPRVAILMGSESDRGIAAKAEEVLNEFGIEFETNVISAHRNPNRIHKYVTHLEQNGFNLVIAIAGLAAHLPGVVASMTVLPVIGVPGDSGPLSGQDALYSIVQMPSGVPVACVGIGNSRNAALLAVEMLGATDHTYRAAMKEYRKKFGDDAC